MTDTVELYEDNAGHLFLVHGDKVRGELEQTESCFDQDARAILDGDTEDWTLPVSSLSEDRVDLYAALVASFNDAYVTTMHSKPEIAASQYILDEMEYPDWGVSGGVMHVYREGRRELRFPYEEMA